MWHFDLETSSNGRTLRFRLRRGNAPAPYSEVLERWREDADFRAFFIRLLADAPLDAYRWETPPVTEATVGREFEFVLLRSDALERTVDPTAFAGQFTDQCDVATFSNLGGDAMMVVPCPRTASSVYVHLASFLRQAPQPQVHRLWQAVGQAMHARLGETPVWLSTAGMGAAWLHVRLDSRPKYYGHAPYRQPV